MFLKGGLLARSCLFYQEKDLECNQYISFTSVHNYFQFRSDTYKADLAKMERSFGVIADIQHADVEDGSDFRYEISENQIWPLFDGDIV